MTTPMAKPSAPPADHAPEEAGGALPIGTRVRMYELPYMRKYWDGYVMPPVTSTPPGHCRVFFDDDTVSTVPVNRLEAV